MSRLHFARRLFAPALCVLVQGCGRTEPQLSPLDAGDAGDTSAVAEDALGRPEIAADAHDDGFEAPATTVTVEIPIVNGDDDALQDPDGTMLVGYDWVSLYSPQHRGGLRFVLATVPRGVELLDAQVEVFVDTDAEDDPNETIGLETRRDPPPFSAVRDDLTSRALGPTTVSWVASSVGSGRVRSPSLVPLLAPVLGAPSYAPGDAVVLVFVPKAGTGSGRVFEFRQREFGGSCEARLILRYRPR